jgi:hypothetical protein
VERAPESADAAVALGTLLRNTGHAADGAASLTAFAAKHQAPLFHTTAQPLEPLVEHSSDNAGAWGRSLVEIRSHVHLKLLNTLSPDQLKALNKEGVRAQIGQLVERLVLDEGIPMTAAERDRVVEEIQDEVFGLGPLEQLLKDNTVSDILVNGFDNVYVERGGRLVETNVRFKDQALSA